MCRQALHLGRLAESGRSRVAKCRLQHSCGGVVHCQLAHPQSKLPAAFLCASQVQAWELLSDSRELQVLPTVSAPGTVWDALQGMAGKAALAGAHGG